MSTLTEFLLARIAEDEAAARVAVVFTDAYDDNPSDDGDEWAAHEGDVWTREVPVLVRGAMVDSAKAAEHMARHDPARVLAECEAKRRIIELGECLACQVEHQPCEMTTALRLLALPYADHPDYDPEWRTESLLDRRQRLAALTREASATHTDGQGFISTRDEPEPERP